MECILHNSDIDHGDFIPFSNTINGPDEKFAQLLEVRDRRMLKPEGSVHRMEDICKSIPDNLHSKDLDTTGYHILCYSRFTQRVCLKNANLAPVPARAKSQRKSVSSSFLPPECIFCNKREVKVSGKSQRCVKFSTFKDEKGKLKPQTTIMDKY